jgi:hypothetical protein
VSTRAKFTGPVPLLVSVTLCGVLFPFTGVSPRLRLVGEIARPGTSAGVPVPDSGMVTTGSRALLVIVRVPVLGPTAVGLKFTNMTH